MKLCEGDGLIDTNAIFLEWLGAIGIALMVAAVLLPRSRLQSVLFALAGVCGSLVTAFLFGRPLLAFLFLLMVLASVIREVRAALEQSKITLNDEEMALRNAHFPAMPLALARRLLDQGHWITARRGEVLIREDEAAPSLFYLVSGSALIERGGHQVGQCTGGDLIGEATVLSGDTATGTVRLITGARLWFVPASVLREYLAANPELAALLHESFARALRGKLAAANTRSAASGAAA